MRRHRLPVRGPLAPIQVCHCQRCRKARGAPFATNTPVEEAAFELLSGRGQITEYESSPGKFRAFCEALRLAGLQPQGRSARRAADPRRAVQRALEARPVFHAYTGSKANWWPIPGRSAVLRGWPTRPESAPKTTLRRSPAGLTHLARRRRTFIDMRPFLPACLCRERQTMFTGIIEAQGHVAALTAQRRRRDAAHSQ